jgi:hypothetical protein
VKGLTDINGSIQSANEMEDVSDSRRKMVE